MSSYKTRLTKRALQKLTPFLFKKCPDGNYHWRWEQICFCRMGEYSDNWNGGIYSFLGDEEMHRETEPDILRRVREAGYRDGRQELRRVHVLLGDRRSGKTHHAAKWVNKKGCSLVVMHERELRRLQQKYGIPRDKLLNWNNMEKAIGGGKTIFWENADLYLADVAHRYGCQLGGWSASIGDNAVILDGKEKNER